MSVSEKINIPVLILAGGLGTRLRHLIPDLPKPMAPVADKPFLYYILNQLHTYGVKDIYLSIGYQSAKIKDYFKSTFYSSHIHYVEEKNPLGTGGAIAHALKQINTENILIINGDTFLNIDITDFESFHNKNKSPLSIALKYVTQSNRYGFVNIKDEVITGFSEKSQTLKDGWINAGIYLLNKKYFFDNIPDKEVFSFEKDFLEEVCAHGIIKGFVANKYFIDIGIPEDYYRAQSDFANCNFLDIDNTWTLFLDRDGVINRKLEGTYVTNIEDFEILPNVVEALKTLRNVFGKIVVVTNQQGINKGMMTQEDLESIHYYLATVLKKQHILLDKIYFAPQLAKENSIMRKPNIGMAIQAKEDFPEIDLKKSIMVGDSISDLKFAKNLAMYSVFISDKAQDEYPYDFRFSSLYKFSQCFNK